MKSQSDAEFLIKIGENLKTIRQGLGWTLEHAEERGYKNWKHLQRLEKGRQDLRICTLKRLADLYGVSLIDILR